jgi:hypothetical protein
MAISGTIAVSKKPLRFPKNYVAGEELDILQGIKLPLIHMVKGNPGFYLAGSG